jgi:type IV pilus assembly protein PilQ
LTKNEQLGEKPMIATMRNTVRIEKLPLGQLLTAVAVFVVFSLPAGAANTLRDISYSAGAGGVVDIVLQLDGPATDAQVFTTDDPPRIAIDLTETSNDVTNKRIAVGAGATSAITVVEAGGRTRVVIDLFHAAKYEARSEANRYVVRVEGTSATAAATTSSGVASPDPAKRLPTSGIELTNVDFRRGENGGGKILLSFSAEGVSADLNDSGDGLVLDVANARLPQSLAQRLDVTDFATPVSSIEIRESAGGARIGIRTSGQYESLAYQSGTEYVVEVTPIVEATEVVGVAEDGARKGYDGTPVTFNFQDIPVRTVLQLIAEESGRNIVASDSVNGSVTLRLINVPWDQALDIVLRAKSLDQREDGNVVWVAPQSEIAAYEQALADARLANEQRAKTVSEYIPINYGSAEDIAKLLTDDAKRSQGGGAGGAQAQGQQQGFLSPRGSVTFDQRTNTLLVNDSEEKIREVKALIEVLDRPVDQVLIEARIVVASETFRRELGARFGVSGANEDSNGNVVTTAGSSVAADSMANVALFNRMAGRSTGLPVGVPSDTAPNGILVPGLANRLNVNLPVNSPAGAIGFAILGADYLIDLELSALEAEGRGEVVTSPRVITANQREAIIRQGDEIGYTTLQPGAAGGVAQFTTEFKEVLLELKVTPTITQDGRVFLALEVKKDELTGFFQSPQGRVPEIATREISTAVLVDNAQTVVIGGVYEFRSAADLTKVPFLGDVPVIGNLFKTKSKNTAKAELLIFVTPKVLAVAGKKK